MPALYEEDGHLMRTSSCTDTSEHCEYWASAGDCGTNPDYMLVQCAQSCGNCSGSVNGCSESERQCFDSSCIPDDWWCDGWYDCSQAEDESECEDATTIPDITTATLPVDATPGENCLESQHQCSDGSCIPGYYWCDGVSDCPQDDDELECGDASPSPDVTTSALPVDFTPGTDCLTGSGVSYRGTVSLTESGQTCQPWASQTPHDHNYTPADYPSSGLEQNYCRNPGGDPGGVWCFTTDPDQQWGFCDVPVCSASSCTDTSEHCEYWASAGECDANPDYMLVQCAQSCGNCRGSFDGCLESERQCLDSSCIPDHWWCDGWNDCPQEDDESECEVEECVEGQRQCLDGSCIPEEYWCDGEVVDCLEAEDEFTCGGSWLQSSHYWAIDATPTLWPDTSGPDKVLDSEEGSFWSPSGPGPWYIIFDFLGPYTFSWMGINNYGDITHDITAFKFQTSASSDPYIWIDALDFNESSDLLPARFAVGGFNGTSRFWRLFITATGPDNSPPWLIDVGFYGIEADPGSIQCAESERQCSNGWCIPDSMWCNDVYGDCPNSEDEADCGDPLSGYTERDGTHYKVFDQAMVYSDAQHACAVDGGHLAHETTQDLHDFLVSLIQESGSGGDYWIGLQDVAHEGDSGLNTWAWSDGTPISDCFSNWAPGEPGNSAGNDCGQLWAGIGLKWDDTYCEIQKNFICQIGPDEENDCAPQGELCMEGQRQCLDGSCINEDYWCDWQFEDCTGGEDEANCEGDLSGYTERDGTNYKVFGQAMTYSDAQQACAVDGGHLADETTQELHDFLVSLIQESGAGGDYWIGLQGVTIDNTWSWSDGTPISDCSFTNWAPGEPGNSPDSPVCGQFWTGAGFKWDDDFCHFQKNFICQIGPGEENACDPNGITVETLTTVEENGGIIVTTPSVSLTTEGKPDQATPPGGLTAEEQPDQATPPGVLTTEGQSDLATPPGALTTAVQPDLATPHGGTTSIAASTTDNGPETETEEDEDSEATIATPGGGMLASIILAHVILAYYDMFA
ncbi:uncharacterized protein [Branchiostoma lanceolatum]|uniref:uncharacterized protein n=1 Tax=Branchiostoma lanceolatum TaxID=7740 RepID=UPI00345434A3